MVHNVLSKFFIYPESVDMNLGCGATIIGPEDISGYDCYFYVGNFLARFFFFWMLEVS